jgi:O-antigen/teichoic acid export membrane protein
VEDNLKHKTKVGAYWQFFNQFCVYGMQFLIGVVMARILTPEDYGITALPTAFYAIAGIFIEGSFGAALIRKEKLIEEDLSTAFLYSSSIGFLFFFLMFIGAPWIAAFFNVPILTSLIRVSVIPFLWSGFMTPQTVILNRKLDFKTPAIIAVISKSFMGLVGISMAYCGYGVWALVVSSLVSSLITVFLTWFLVRWRPKTGWSRDSFRYLWGFGNKMIATLLIDRTYMNIVPLIIGKYYSPAQLGEYNRAQGYAQLPAQQFTNLLHNVSYPVMSKMQEDIDLLRSNYRRMLRLCAFVMFPIMILMAVLAKPLIVLLVTEKWIACVPYLQLMCVAMMWYPIHSINLALLLVKGRSDLFLRLEIIKKTIGLLIIAVSLPFGIIPFLIGTIVHTLLCLFVNTYYTGKIINVGFFMQMWDVVPVLLLTATVAATTYVTTMFSDIYFLQLLVGCIVGSLTYLLGGYIFKFTELKDLKYMLNRKF